MNVYTAGIRTTSKALMQTVMLKEMHIVLHRAVNIPKNWREEITHETKR
jgi:hypothetical protein